MKQVISFVLCVFVFSKNLDAQSFGPADITLPWQIVQETPKSDQIIFQLMPGVSLNRFMYGFTSHCQAARNIFIVKTLSKRQHIYLLSASQIIDRQAFISFLKKQPEVVSASWNAPVNFRDTNPNDELFDAQWSLERIGVPKVWDVTTGGLTANGHEIVVAVLDKGFDLVHPDLIENYWKNPGEIPNDGLDNDDNGYVDDVYGWNFRQNIPIFSVERHGTAVNGIIGATGDNGIGTAGINWNVKLLPLSIEYADEVVAAFNYVLELRERYNATNGAEGSFVVVTNGSFGIDEVSCEEQPGWGAMYDPLGTAGVLSVAATANGDWDVDQVGDIPTSCTSEYLITVTNTGLDDNRAPGSAFGKNSIDLGAPGQSTATASINGMYREDFSGTSSACPHVAGAIALLYSVPCTAIDSLALTSPASAAKLLREAILQNTDAISSLNNETVTGGRLNVYEAMKYLHAYCIAKAPELAEGDFKEKYVGKKGLVQVSPNPVSDKLYIDYGNVDFKDVKIRVFNMLGQEMVFSEATTSEPFEKQTVWIDVSDWSTGVYVVNMYDLTKKISMSFLKL